MIGARELFPGGVNSPVRAYRGVGGRPPVPVRGQGARIWDAEGREYIDFVGAFGPLILGHADPEVVEAIQSAARAGGPYGLTAEPEIELGRLIQAAMPHLERMRFVSSGTEAAMSALRLARAATGRDLVIKFDGCYHGHSDGLLAKAGSGVATLGLPGSSGVPAPVAAQTLVLPYNDLEAVAAAFSAFSGRIAAVIVEPVAANMGVVLPRPEYLEGLRRLTRAEGALLVFDEVITGFRIARGGAVERFGVIPDLTLLGKVIGGGLPVGAYGGRADLMDMVAPSGPVYQAGTLSGHPLVMAAGIATLRRLDGAFYSRLEETTQALAAALRRSLPSTAVAACCGLLTVFMASQPPDSMGAAAGADTLRFAGFFHHLRERGVLIPPSQFEAWFVGAAHGSADLAQVEEAARAF